MDQRYQLKQSRYLYDLLNTDQKSYHQKLSTALKRIRPHKNKFDAIVFTGCSGALTAIPIATALKKKLLLIRKSTASCHANSLFEGDLNAMSKSILIIDDFSSTGNTLKRIRKYLKANGLKEYGVFLWHNQEITLTSTL